MPPTTPDLDRDAHLRAILRQLPAAPGVYLMKGANGRVLYVGKADVLRNRVRSYFGKGPAYDARIERMVARKIDTALSRDLRRHIERNTARR